jgi:hypothetical protein
VAAIIDGPNGFIHGMSINEDTVAYQGASAIYFRNGDATTLQGYDISDVICTDSSLDDDNPYYSLYYNNAGVLSATNPIDAGITLTNVEMCDGSKKVYKSISLQGETIDTATFGFVSGKGFYAQSTQTLIANPSLGLKTDVANSVVSLHNSSLSATSPDSIGVDGNGSPFISQPAIGSFVDRPITPPLAPTLALGGTASVAGTGSATYYCTAVDAFDNETTAGATATITTVPASLSSSSYVAVSCPQTTGYHSFNVYLMANDAGRTQGKIGNLSMASWGAGLPFKDTGLSGTGSFAPATNSTGLDCFTAVAVSSSSPGACIGFTNTAGKLLFYTPATLGSGIFATTDQTIGGVANTSCGGTYDPSATSAKNTCILTASVTNTVLLLVSMASRQRCWCATPERIRSRSMFHRTYGVL